MSAERPPGADDAAAATGDVARLLVLVPAAGGGARFGGARRKQYAPLDGRPLLACTLERLAKACPDAVLAIAVAPDDEEHRDVLDALPQKVHVIACGGPTRAATVRAALLAVGDAWRDHDWLLVHDAARPCVPVEALQRLRASLADDAVGGLLAVPVADTLKRAAASAGDNAHAPRVERTEDRTGLWQAQTPQMFRFGVIRAALAHADAVDVTDEARAVELLARRGGCAAPRLVPGSPLNVKVTYPADLELARAILSLQRDR
jgi:2-C-methyl-D-erythritol 4-phosphate cytidylyltransferase